MHAITGFEYYPSGALIEHGALLFPYRLSMGHYLSMGHDLVMLHFLWKYTIFSVSYIYTNIYVIRLICVGLKSKLIIML